ncbi:hypothetical protein VPH35_103074 [Triticum aestivum]
MEITQKKRTEMLSLCNSITVSSVTKNSRPSQIDSRIPLANVSLELSILATWNMETQLLLLLFGIWTYLSEREMGTDKFGEMGTDKFSEGWLRVNYCDQVGNKCFL